MAQSQIFIFIFIFWSLDWRIACWRLTKLLRYWDYLGTPWDYLSWQSFKIRRRFLILNGILLDWRSLLLFLLTSWTLCTFFDPLWCHLKFLVFHDFPFWLHMYHLWLPRIALHSCINSLDFFLCVLIVNFWKIGLSH